MAHTIADDEEALKYGSSKVAETIEKLAAPLANPFIDGLNRYQRGRLALSRGDTGEAEVHFHEALEIQRDAALLPGLLRTMEAIAEILTRKDKLEDVEHHLLKNGLQKTLGAETFNKLRSNAAASDLQEIIGLVSRMRGKRAGPLMGWHSLTPTERRVVSLATEGLSNPQIAERMFIARGTVKVHLSHIYEKLDVSSRTQFAAKAVTDEFEA